MLKKSLLAIASSLMLGLFVMNTIPAVANTTTTTQFVDEGECDKCGKKECKGSCGEAKEEGQAKAGEKKSCTTAEGGKSCCAHGQSKKETKAEEKKK